MDMKVASGATWATDTNMSPVAAWFMGINVDSSVTQIMDSCLAFGGNMGHGRLNF